MVKKLKGQSTTVAQRRAGVTRPPYVRMVRIQKMLGQSDFPNCRTMAKELEVSEKTVARDLEVMRDQMGVPGSED